MLIDGIVHSTQKMILAQTAAGPDYEAMLAATAPVHRAFCAANDIDFRSFVGVRRGYHPWQATLNRIEMLKDLLDAGWRGWFVYLDADALILQPEFDIRRFLGRREAYALVAAPGAPDAERWAINIGVFFLNLGHELGREIAMRWWEITRQTLSEDMLRAAVEPWQALPDGRPFPDDQHLLQMVLMRNPHLLEALYLITDGVVRLGTGRFIRQYLRVLGSPAERLERICEAATAVTTVRTDGT